MALTCGVCTSIVIEEEIENYQCTKDWYTVTINSQSKTFYPTNEKGEYLAKVMWNNKEQILLLKYMSNYPLVTKKIRVDNEAKSSLLTDECRILENISQNLAVNSEELDNIVLEELLIEEVRKRPPIYNYTLPLSVRSRQKIADLWKEISEALSNRMSPEDTKRRWKTLKDTFSKIVAEEKKHSGSARTPKKSWKHLEQMSFLRSVSTNRNSISNITMNVTNKNLFEDNGDNIEDYKGNEDGPIIKRRKVSDNLSVSVNRMVDALCTKETPVINLPKLPEISPLDGMFLYIKQRLQTLNSETQDRLLLKFLQDITMEEQK